MDERRLLLGVDLIDGQKDRTGGLAQVRPAYDRDKRTPGRGGVARVVKGLAKVAIIETSVSTPSHPASPPSSRPSPSGKDASLHQFFGPGGILSRTHPAYEFRRG